MAFISTFSIEGLFVAFICAGVAQTLLLLTLLRGGKRVRLPKQFRVGKTRSRVEFDLSPVVWSAGTLGFGLFGLLIRSFTDADGLASILYAVAADVSFVLVLLFALRRLLAGGDAMEGGTLLGSMGVISLPIPAHGVGSMSYVAEGKRHVIPARSSDELPLEQGTRVMVVSLENRVAVVEEL